MKNSSDLVRILKKITKWLNITSQKFDFSKDSSFLPFYQMFTTLVKWNFDIPFLKMEHPIDGDSIIISFQEGQTTFYNAFLTMLLFSLVIGL